MNGNVNDQAKIAVARLRCGVTELPENVPVQLQLVLSLFPGIGLLDRGFEEAGFCVVRGPDLIWGGDIRRFLPIPNRFDGVIAGSPCQDFSSLRRIPPTGNGRAMLDEFVRVVEAARPDWWLLENVPGVPDVKIDGYSWQRIDLRANEFGLPQRRLRHIQFGSRRDMILIVQRHAPVAVTTRCVTAGDTVTAWSRFCQLQGLPDGFDIPAFRNRERRRAVGNGVPLPMARALAAAVAEMVPEDSVRLCACRCGRVVSGNQVYAGAACRMRAMRRRNAPE